MGGQDFTANARFPHGWSIAGGGDPNRFPAPDARWRACAPQQVRHPFVLPSDGHVHGVEWEAETQDRGKTEHGEIVAAAGC